ncbi:hypothetical protein Smp_155190 [Schistosoma mansoni]|uniref:hypothetical protein n=1 Tax=Schistosoma mansoni TaxID=6183 RepID=UPI00022DC10E|nr:hypothetical protein Smp_155190 [Schistosoma mansoni]|eukprot:XP_018652810.1 hypothetical protein Smp_155190 [Schistosoma mansoni]
MSEYSINSRKCNQHVLLRLITSQTVSSKETNSMNNNNSIINYTIVVTNVCTTATINISIPTATSIVSDIVPLPRVKHPTIIDYVTHDETRLYDKKNNRLTLNKITGQRSYSVDSDCDSDSRPLSDAMISNHDYDLNRNINYQEISMESSLQEEDRKNSNHQILYKSHPPLPPLWYNNNNTGSSSNGGL